MKNKASEQPHKTAGIEYRLIRLRRKSLSIQICDGMVIVKAPAGTPFSAVEAFIEKKRNWIAAKTGAYAAKRRKFSDVLEYRAFLLDGAQYPAVMSGGIKKIMVADGRFLIPQPLFEMRDKLISAVRKWYIARATEQLGNRLQQLAGVLGFAFSGFNLTGARAKWGSCDPNNRIRLNWRLVLLNPELQDYVIIHELCHTKRHNHGKEFWEAVAKHCPLYKDARKKLKEYSLLTGLY